MRVKVWDFPLRLFHWLLVIAIGAAWVTAELSEDLGDSVIEIHSKIGLFILGLVVFRIVWGFVGSTHARFLSFFPTPARLKSYFRGDSHPMGHNPMGALSVFALLTLLLLQAVSGLFANDDISFHGPLFQLIDSGLSDRLTKVHHIVFDALTILIGLHIAAIVFYVRIKRNNILKPMITGYRDNAHGSSAQGGGVIPFLIAVLIAGSVVCIASGELLTAPVAQAAPAPSW
jgi:cytochrome b